MISRLIGRPQTGPFGLGCQGIAHLAELFENRTDLLRGNADAAAFDLDHSLGILPEGPDSTCPPGRVNLAAFDSRLVKTWMSLSRSASDCGLPSKARTVRARPFSSKSEQLA